MSLTAIHGSLLDSQNFQATYGVNTIQEELLIEMSSPLESQTDVVSELPVIGQAGDWTFTIGLSPHPKRTDLVLKSCDGVREAPNGRPFWIISLTYETPQWLNDVYPGEDRGRGNLGRKKKIDNNNKPIVYPWDEPPTWSSSIRTVRLTRFHDKQGNLLRHANGLPLTDGIDTELILEAHSFTWNVAYSGFSYATKIRPYLYKVNSSSAFNRSSGFVFFDSVSCTENYRDVTIPGTDDQPATYHTHHFFTINATFLIDTRSSSGNAKSYFEEQYRRVSMHTMQKTVFAGVPSPTVTYYPIIINDRGDFAEAPWPLLSQAKATALGKSFGEAVPYGIMDSVDPITDFHFIDPGLPETAALHTFIADNKLVIP